MKQVKIWTLEEAPVSIELLQSSTASSDEKVRTNEQLQNQLASQLSAVQTLGAKFDSLAGEQYYSTGIIYMDLVTDTSKFVESDAIEEPAKVKEEIQTLQAAIANVQKVLATQNAEIQKQVATTEIYKAEINELVPWLMTAEIEADTSSVKPSSVEEIEALLKNAQVRHCEYVVLPRALPNFDFPDYLCIFVCAHPYLPR